MTRKGRLLTSLDVYQGKDYQAEWQKSMQKKAAKRKKDSVSQHQVWCNISGRDSGNVPGMEKNSKTRPNLKDILHQGHATAISISTGRPNQVDQRQESFTMNNARTFPDVDDPGGDIPFSDIEELSDTDRSDLVPHQRLSINNTTALLSAHASLSQLSLSTSLFSDVQAVTSSLPTTSSVADADDDFGRELALHKQCLDAAIMAHILLQKEGVSFSRPRDFFAEMIKSDDHMSKIKKRMTDEATAKKASAEAKRQRDLKKFGKQVQIAKGQERDKERRATLNSIETLKRKRRQDNGSIVNTAENDFFDVAVEESDKPKVKSNGKESGASRRRLPTERHKKDEKFGFGGKKRHSKSGDAISSGDTRNYSLQKMKAKSPRRLGKSRRPNRASL